MQINEVLQRLSLEGRHFQLEKVEAPIIDPTLYNTLGKDLFDIYKKYDVSEEDQRKIESLTYCLMNFTVAKDNPPKKWWSFKKKESQ